MSLVYKGRTLCAQRPIGDNSVWQLILISMFSWSSVFLQYIGFSSVFNAIDNWSLSLQSPKTCYPCSVCSVCTCGGKGTHWGFRAQTAPCSCAHLCRPQYSLQIVKKTCKIYHTIFMLVFLAPLTGLITQLWNCRQGSKNIRQLKNKQQIFPFVQNSRATVQSAQVYTSAIWSCYTAELCEEQLLLELDL